MKGTGFGAEAVTVSNKCAMLCEAHAAPMVRGSIPSRGLGTRPASYLQGPLASNIPATMLQYSMSVIASFRVFDVQLIYISFMVIGAVCNELCT